MKDFNEIGKRMPYSESSEYINNLIEVNVDKVLGNPKPNMHSRFIRKVVMSTAAAAAVIVGVFFTIPHGTQQDRIMKQISQSKSLDEVLNSLNSEQIQELTDYTTDDIPEY